MPRWRYRDPARSTMASQSRKAARRLVGMRPSVDPRFGCWPEGSGWLACSCSPRVFDVALSVAEAELELPALERLERQAELLPGQVSAVDHHTVRLTVLAPDKPAGQVVPRDDPVVSA